MEILACLVPLYAMHRLVPIACATCVGLACYVLARQAITRRQSPILGAPSTPSFAVRLTRIIAWLVGAARAGTERSGGGGGANQGPARVPVDSESVAAAAAAKLADQQLCPVAAIYHNAEPRTLLLTPELHSEVASVVDSILQSFILPWFSPLSASQEFPNHVEGILEDTLLELSHKLALIHPARALQVCIETACCHLQQLPRCRQSSESVSADHPAAADRRSEWLYLESLATVALRLVEPGDVLTAKATHLLVVHLICSDLLLPIVDLLSRPDMIYYAIVELCATSTGSEHTPSPNSTSSDVLTTTYMNHADHHDDHDDDDDARAAWGGAGDESGAVAAAMAVNSSFSAGQLQENARGDMDPDDDHGSARGGAGGDIMSELARLTTLLKSSPSAANNGTADCGSASEAVAASCSEAATSQVRHGATIPSSISINNNNNINHSNRVSHHVRQLLSPSSAATMRTPATGTTASAVAASAAAAEDRGPDHLHYDHNHHHHHHQRHRGSTNSSPYRARPSIVAIDRAVEADHFTTDGMSLHKVHITKTESRSEHGKGVYTVYCIEYQPHAGGQLYYAKRRFNEFLNLQTALSKLSKVESRLRGIKGPSRWLANPFINDKKNVTNRRMYLQNYLIQLSCIAEVVGTIQFQLFMGVVGNPDNYFTGGPTAAGYNPLRIDRMLAEGVRGALDLIKTALPGDISPSRDSGDAPLLAGGASGTSSSNNALPAGRQHQQPRHLWTSNNSYVELKYDQDFSGRRLRQAVFNYIDSFDLASSPEFSPVHHGGASPLTPAAPPAYSALNSGYGASGNNSSAATHHTRLGTDDGRYGNEAFARSCGVTPSSGTERTISVAATAPASPANSAATVRSPIASSASLTPLLLRGSASASTLSPLPPSTSSVSLSTAFTMMPPPKTTTTTTTTTKTVMTPPTEGLWVPPTSRMVAAGTTRLSSSPPVALAEEAVENPRHKPTNAESRVDPPSSPGQRSSLSAPPSAHGATAAASLHPSLVIGSSMGSLSSSGPSPPLLSPASPPLPSSAVSVSCNPLVRSLLDLITAVLEGSEQGSSSRIPAFLFRMEGAFGPLAEEWLSDKLEEAFSSQNCAIILHKLHEFISGLGNGGDMSPSGRSLEEARQALRSLVPEWILSFIPGIDEMIDGVLQSLSQERFNRALIYKLADVLLDLLASADNIEAWTSAHR